MKAKRQNRTGEFQVRSWTEVGGTSGGKRPLSHRAADDGVQRSVPDDLWAI
jgi:hypothetical protein